jgi:hypothetical protein
MEEEEDWHGVENSDIQSIGIHTSLSNSSGTYYDKLLREREYHC